MMYRVGRTHLRNRILHHLVDRQAQPRRRICALGDDEGDYGKGSWLRLPAGASHHPRSERGCMLYIKQSGLAYLRSTE